MRSRRWIIRIALGTSLVSSAAAAQTAPPPAEPEPTETPAAVQSPAGAGEEPVAQPTGEPPSAPTAVPPPAPLPPPSSGSSGNPEQDTGVSRGGAARSEREPKKLPWHDSIFFIDQSTTTQTIGLGSDYQSDDPVYELWYAFRPRYYFYDTEFDAVNVNARIEATHELTNSNSTTQEREFQLNDIWINGVYEHYFVRDRARGFSTKLSTGPRMILGVSKTSRGVGTPLQIGGGVGAAQMVPLAGPHADVFQTVTFSGSAYYMKPLNRCTTACSPGFEYTRQDSGGRTLVSDQVAGTSRINHQLTASLGAEVAILEPLKFSLSYFWIMQWLYPIDEQAGTVQTLSGPVQPRSNEDPATFRVSPWIIADVDYDLMKELTLSLGYYNYTNQIGQDGQRRNPLWSPDARFFFTVTANLDAIYERATGTNSKRVSKGSPPARTRLVASPKPRASSAQ